MKLAKIVVSSVISVDGFNIYKNAPKREMIKKIANTNGIIIFTDSDAAGKRIRNYIKNFVGDGAKVKNAYIPEVMGKEKRKKAASKEGKLGIEGMSEAVLGDCLRRCIPFEEGTPRAASPTTSLNDLYEIGLAGQKDSGYKRREICEKYNLPRNLSTKQFLEAVNLMKLTIKNEQ